MSDVENTWRAWMMTGARLTPVDRRRLRGAHRALKAILLERRLGNRDHTQGWRDFSGAMARHEVEDAIGHLPPEDSRLVKLAYFGGYSNREVAREVGLTEWTVRRRLHHALASISDYIQQGRALGRRVLSGPALLLSGRWVSEHAWTATAVAAAAVVIVAAQPSPGSVRATAPASRATSTAGAVVVPAPSPAALAHLPAALNSVSTSVSLPGIRVPNLKLPLPLPTPPRLNNLL